MHFLAFLDSALQARRSGLSCLTADKVKIIGRAQFQAEQELVIHGESRLVNMNFYPIYNNGTNVGQPPDPAVAPPHNMVVP